MPRSRLTLIPVAVTIATLIAACGTNSSSPGRDSGSVPPSDAGSSDSASSDAGGSDVGGSAPGSTLTGMNGFPVTGAVLYTQGPVEDCGTATVLPDGSLAAFALILAGAGGATLCDAISSNTALPDGAPFVLVQVASSTYASGDILPDGGSQAALTPGTYPIGYQGVSDDDLCMFSQPGAQALVDVGRFGIPDAGGATPVATSLSGTVTVTTVTQSHVAGSFTVMLAAEDANGNIDTQNPTPFAGTFDVTSCPGDAGM